MSKDYDWTFFDDIRCINLYTREDRYHQVNEIFQTFNIPVRFYQTHKHPNGGIQGCFESHIEIIREDYDKGFKNVLIFEDDVINSSYLTPKNLKRAIQFMQNHDWDIFYLGTHPDVRKYRVQHIVNGIYAMHCICTHAYCLSRNMMKKLYDLKFNGTPIDYLYRDYECKSYGIYPSLFYQRSSKSDIGGDIISTIPIKEHWFRVVELYAIYINVPIDTLSRILIVVIILIVILVIYWKLTR